MKAFHPAPDYRKIDLGKIHQAKKSLHMTDEDYRAMLQAKGGVQSAADLNAGARTRVLSYLQTLGYQPTQRKSPAKPLSASERKVWVLWYQLEAKGRVNVPANPQARGKALRAFVKRQTGVDDLAFLNFAQIMNLIEAMKSWVNRSTHLPRMPNDE